MTDPISFSSTTPLYALPNLFPAQAQKEVTINEALARMDMLMHPAVEAILDDPPLSPAEGQCWIVGAAPTGEWTGHADELAGWQAGNWIFVSPQQGMVVSDTASGGLIRYDSGWDPTVAVSAPSGGSTVDAEARAAIVQLITALVTAGILPSV